MFFNHNKIRLYLVTNNVDLKLKNILETSDIEALSKLEVYCITTTKEEAKEYIDKLVFLKHRTHFLSWCYLNKIEYLPTQDEYPPKEIWDKYYNVCIKHNPPEYIYGIASYKLEDIASILRIFSRCVPLGCEFEKPIEAIQFQAWFNDSHINDGDKTDAPIGKA